jgi:hypothetical protein
VLPEVENPIPKTIGLSNVFEIAAAGGVVGLVLATTWNISNRETWAANGVVAAFAFSACIYLISLLTQLL